MAPFQHLFIAVSSLNCFQIGPVPSSSRNQHPLIALSSTLFPCQPRLSLCLGPAPVVTFVLSAILAIFFPQREHVSLHLLLSLALPPVPFFPHLIAFGPWQQSKSGILARQF